MLFGPECVEFDEKQCLYYIDMVGNAEIGVRVNLLIGYFGVLLKDDRLEKILFVFDQRWVARRLLALMKEVSPEHDF